MQNPYSPETPQGLVVTFDEGMTSEQMVNGLLFIKDYLESTHLASDPVQCLRLHFFNELTSALVGMEYELPYCPVAAFHEDGTFGYSEFLDPAFS